MVCFAFANDGQDSVKFDRDVLGRPFDLDEIFGEIEKEAVAAIQGEPAKWHAAAYMAPDSVYYGIGKSAVSQEAADDQARLKFAQHVSVKVQSIAAQQIKENKDRLEENYSYESFVATDMTLRSVVITDRYVTKDSVYFSLIQYSKPAYHKLVTEEIQIALEATIRKQELAHQAAEALRADSLRHKLAMDSLALGRKQAIIDSLAAILKMEEAKIRQEQDRIELIKSRYAAFLAIKPRYLAIDVPTAKSPESFVHASGRWNPENSHIRQLSLGASLWLLTVEASVFGTDSYAEASLRLEVLPSRGELYPVELAIGYINYVSAFDDDAGFDLRDPGSFGDIGEEQMEGWQESPDQGGSFLVAATIGVPQMNSHLSAYYDNRKVSLSSIWYPFPRNMGDAISIINQVDIINDENYRNDYDDQFQWQFGLRLIAISDRFATMVSYEDHDVWMLNFEFQY